MFKWLKKFFTEKACVCGCEYDGFEEARLKAAIACMKAKKPISGTMYEDGTLIIDKEKKQ